MIKLTNEKNYSRILYYIFFGMVHPEQKYIDQVMNFQKHNNYILLANKNGVRLYKRL